MFEVGMIVRVDNAPRDNVTYYSSRYGNMLFHNSEMNRYKGYDFVVKRVLASEYKVVLDFLNQYDREKVDSGVSPADTIDSWVWHFDWLTFAEDDVEVDCTDLGDLL